MCKCTYSGVAGCPNCAPKASQPKESQPETLELTASQVLIAVRALNRDMQLMVVQDLCRKLDLHYQKPPTTLPGLMPPSCSTRFQCVSYAYAAYKQEQGLYPLYYLVSEVDEYFKKEAQEKEQSATDRVSRAKMVLELREMAASPGMSYCYPIQANCMRMAANLMEKQLCE